MIVEDAIRLSNWVQLDKTRPSLLRAIEAVRSGVEMHGIGIQRSQFCPWKFNRATQRNRNGTIWLERSPDPGVLARYQSVPTVPCAILWMLPYGAIAVPADVAATLPKRAISSVTLADGSPWLRFSARRPEPDDGPRPPPID